MTFSRTPLLLVLVVSVFRNSHAFEVSTVKNFRPVFADSPSCRFFRCASLDQLSQEDADRLLQEFGSDLTLIDLRNRDEIKKQTRTEGSLYLYDKVANQHHVPILKDVNAFWDEAIDRMDGPTKLKATLATITQAGALDRAAARLLEDEGLSMLYTVMLATASQPLRQTLQVCASASGPVIFHCQKGKDRTGVVAMLLQSCSSNEISDQEIVRQYALSGELLGETPGSSSRDDKERSSGTMLDWSKFRGSPSVAMEDTLEWIRQHYGSVVDGYLVKKLQLDAATLENLSRSSLAAPETSARD